MTADRPTTTTTTTGGPTGSPTLTFRGGGWVIVLAAVLVVLLLGWSLLGPLLGRRPVGDGRRRHVVQQPGHEGQGLVQAGVLATLHPAPRLSLAGGDAALRLLAAERTEEPHLLVIIVSGETGANGDDKA